MKTLTLADGVAIDAVEYASRANAILGIRDSGKTYTATMIAEGLFDAGVPFFALDPIGRWRFLRMPGAGFGYPIVVAGGAAPDLPLSPDNAADLVRAAMKAGISMVLDLYDVKLSKADWRKIVRTAIETMLYEGEGHGQRHVFLEEAAEFIPQKVYDGQTYAAVEKLARMGGNVGVGLTLINQRAEEVNKAVLELCDNLLLHRQKGKNSLLSLRKWLDAGDVTEAKEIVKSLPRLPTGECWAWLRELHQPIRMNVARKNSFDANRRDMARTTGTNHSRGVDVSSFVAAVKAALAGKTLAAPKFVASNPKIKLEEKQVNEKEAKALRDENDALRRQIVDLQGKLGLHAAHNAEVNRVSTDDFDRLYAEIVERLRREDPEKLLRVIKGRPEIEVSIERKVINVDDKSLRGQAAILISEGFFDNTATGNSAFNELKRRGKSVAKPSVYRECDNLARDGFLTKEGGGYRSVEGMKVNIVEER